MLKTKTGKKEKHEDGLKPLELCIINHASYADPDKKESNKSAR